MSKPTKAEQKEFLGLIGEFQHVGLAQDEFNRRRVPSDKQCSRCGGTGNQLMFMYQKCEACGGDGVSRGNESDFGD